MPLVPIASFLTGSLLTLLLPVALLIALVIWYWKFSAAVPETVEADIPASPAEREAAAPVNPGPVTGSPAPATGNPGSSTASGAGPSSGEG